MDASRKRKTESNEKREFYCVERIQNVTLGSENFITYNYYISWLR